MDDPTLPPGINRLPDLTDVYHVECGCLHGQAIDPATGDKVFVTIACRETCPHVRLVLEMMDEQDPNKPLEITEMRHDGEDLSYG